MPWKRRWIVRWYKQIHPYVKDKEQVQELQAGLNTDRKKKLKFKINKAMHMEWKKKKKSQLHSAEVSNKENERL